MATRPLTRDVLPIFVMRLDKQAEPLSFEGTGFLVRNETLVTCWHCVARTLTEDMCYAVAVDSPQGYDAVRLYDIAQDPSGADLATAKVELQGNIGFEIANKELGLGTDVYSFGYPFTTQFGIEGRLLRGYITRGYVYKHPSQGNVFSYELDMPCPAGLSGAPVIHANSRILLGVVYGSHDVATIDTAVSVDPETGERQPEVQRLVSFGLAHHHETLRNLRGPATGNVPLAELLKS